MKKRIKRVRVVAAVIEQGEKILIAQRKKDDTFPGKWEFPGGKVKKGESDQEALARELREETGALIEVQDLILEHIHDYTSISVSLGFYRATLDQGAKLSPHAHEELRWVSQSELSQFDFLEADLPLLKKLNLGLFNS